MRALSPPLTEADQKVVDSIRNPHEVEALRALDDFFLLAVQAPDELRFARIQARGRAGDVATVAEFRDVERRENSTRAAEQRIGATVELADATVENDGSLAALEDRVTAVLERVAGD